MNYLLNKINKTFCLWFLLFMYLTTAVHAQEPSFVELKEEPVFTISQDEEQHVSLFFLIEEGFHIQADEVKDDNLIPSVLSIDPSDELMIGKPVFPDAHEFRMNGVDEPLHVFSDILEIKIPVKATRPLEKGVSIIEGKLHYQPCDVSKCFFPRDLEFTMEISVE